MQKRSILFIGFLAMLAIVVVGSASAFDLGSILGDSSSADEPQTVTIEGINFTIPEGYKEADNSSFENETASVGSLTYTMNGKTFENGSDAFAILIADYGDYNVTEDILTQIADDKATYGGQDGYVKVDNGFTVFSYIVDGDLVSISTSDDSVIDEILS